MPRTIAHSTSGTSRDEGRVNSQQPPRPGPPLIAGRQTASLRLAPWTEGRGLGLGRPGATLCAEGGGSAADKGETPPSPTAIPDLGGAGGATGDRVRPRRQHGGSLPRE